MMYDTFILFRAEPQVLRIETTHAPKPSQPEVVLSDGKFFFSLRTNLVVVLVGCSEFI